jgi:hypothetical protein
MSRSIDLPALRVTLLAALLTGCSEGKIEGDDGSDSAPAEDDDGGETSSCEGATPILDAAGAETGYVRCADGAINRVGTHTWPDGSTLVPTCEGTEEDLQCETDAECTARAGGQCAHQEPWGYAFCGCVYPCTADADCETGEVCLGDGVVTRSAAWPTCVPAACATGDDCAAEECGIGSYDDGCGRVVELACRESTDTCRADADCASVDGECALGYGVDDDFACRTQNCDVGRPLVVDGASRVAPTSARASWGAAPAGLPRDAEKAAWWLRTAHGEHASVASFARVVLELLALGAPAALVLTTQQAMADEVRHAELAFGLAQAFGGAPVGPGPLDLSGVAPETEPAAILRRLIAEACVNETLCVADAMAARAGAHPSERAVLDTIVEDETRHAALAWRTLGWLLRDAPDLRPVATAAFAEARARFAGHPAWGGVVGPCAAVALAA